MKMKKLLLLAAIIFVSLALFSFAPKVNAATCGEQGGVCTPGSCGSGLNSVPFDSNINCSIEVGQVCCVGSAPVGSGASSCYGKNNGDTCTWSGGAGVCRIGTNNDDPDNPYSYTACVAVSQSSGGYGSGSSSSPECVGASSGADCWVGTTAGSCVSNGEGGLFCLTTNGFPGTSGTPSTGGAAGPGGLQSTGGSIGGAVTCPGGSIVGGFCVPGNTGLANPSGGLFAIISNFLMWLIGIFGFLALVGFIISGIQYILAAGDEGIMETAKRNMTYTIIGVIVGLSGLVILNAVTAALNAAPIF